MDIRELKEKIGGSLALPRRKDNQRSRVEYWHGYIAALSDVEIISEDEATDLHIYINRAG